VIEREVKLAAPPGFRLLDLGRVADDIVVTAAPDRRFATIYWDTEDLRLIRWGCTLRFRVGEDWTVKLPHQPGARGVLTRAEHVFPGTPKQPPPEAVDLVRAYVRNDTLVPVARMHTVRRVVSLRTSDGRPLAEVDDDDVSILDGRRVATRFREIEVEIPESAPEDFLHAVVDQLVAAGAHPPDPTPKLVRALGARALEPPEVQVAPLPKDARAGDAVRRAIAASVQRLLRNDPGVRIGEDPEAVHQARVATRRLRSDLRTFAPLVDRAWADSLREELRWVAGELGAVRDGQVLLMRLRATAAELVGLDPKPLDAVLGELAAEVEQERARLLEGMRDPRYITLLDDLVAAAADPTLAADADRPATEVMPRLVARPRRRLVQAHAALSDPPADDELHQLRIMAKRVRYAAEAVAPVVGKQAAALAAAAAGLQEVLGDFHDAVVAAQWLRSHAGRGTARAFATGALYAMELRKAEEGRQAWPAAWKALDKRKLRSWM
jgi:CHAD domain-containing protein